MTEIARARVSLTWDNGGPGVNTFHFTKGTLVGDDWEDVGETFFEELAGVYVTLADYMISTLTWAIEPTFDILDVESGDITGVATAGGDFHTGAGASSATKNSRATQICVNYATDIWQDGRRLRGRTFFGPIDTNAMQTDGTIGSADQTAIRNSFTAITSGVGPRLAVYHRPGPSPASVGYLGDVVQATVKTLPAILRSRRD